MVVILLVPLLAVAELLVCELAFGILVPIGCIVSRGALLLVLFLVERGEGDLLSGC